MMLFRGKCGKSSVRGLGVKIHLNCRPGALGNLFNAGTPTRSPRLIVTADANAHCEFPNVPPVKMQLS